MTEQHYSELRELFNTQEKWDAFLELWYVKDSLRNHWFDQTAEKVRQLVVNHPNGKPWLVSSGYFWIRLSPSEEGVDSLSINIDFSARKSSLWVNANLFDSASVSSDIQANVSTLLPCLPGYVSNNHPWCPMLKDIPSDIINFEPDWKTFDSYMYKWAADGDSMAVRIFSEFFEPLLKANMASLFAEISKKAQK